MRPELVHDWGIEQGVGMLINGKPLSLPVAIEGPMVEAVDEWHHVLWVPLIADGPAPRAGRPNAEPAVTSDGDA